MYTVKIKNYIDTAIYKYPSLYRATDYKDSRILVLGCIFATIGTGLEWHPDGYMAEHCGKKYHPVKKRCLLPENYFSYDLWEEAIFDTDVEEVEKFLKGHYYYFLPKCILGDKSVIFEASKEFAVDFVKNFGINFLTEKREKDSKDSEFYRKDRSAHEASSYTREYKPVQNHLWLGKYYKGYTPYPMCQYSPLVEMIDGETHSAHIKDFKLKKIQPDWVEGALEIAKYILDFYSDPEKYHYDHSHPSNCLNDFKKYYNENPKKFREDRKDDGMGPEHTIEDWCEICWQRHHRQQMGYCEKLIEKYGNS